MRNFILVILLCSSLNYSQYSIKRESVAKGLEHIQYILESKTDKQNINVLEIDLSINRIELKLSMDQIIGQENISSIVKRYGGLAGINGGFSFSNNPTNIYHGDPNGFLAIDGKILSMPRTPRSSFGIISIENKQIPFLTIPEVKVLLKKNDKIVIDSMVINQMVEAVPVFFDNYWHKTTLTPKGIFNYIFNKNKFIEISEISTEIPDNGFVIASEEKLNVLDLIGAEDNIYSFETIIQDSFWGNKTEYLGKNFDCTSAGPIILFDGEIIENYSKEGFKSNFTDKRHPRTGIGFSKDMRKLYMIVVDGRNNEVGNGFALWEFAEFMKLIGISSGYNLDGGGSSVMVIGNEIINYPSDGNERRRCDGWIIFPK